MEINLFSSQVKIQLKLYIRLCPVNNTQTKIYLIHLKKKNWTNQIGLFIVDAKLFVVKR